MKKCDRLEKTLYNGKSLADALTGGGALEAHVKDCPDCAAYLAASQKAEKMLESLSGAEEKINFNIGAEQSEIISKINKIKKAEITFSGARKAAPEAEKEISFFEKLAGALFQPKFAAGVLAVLFIAALLFYSAYIKTAGNKSLTHTTKNGAGEDKLYAAVKTSGKVIVSMNGTKRELTAGETIPGGSIIKTSTDSECVLRSGYAKIRLDSASAAAVDELRVRLLAGGAVMEFDKNSLGGGKKFIVSLKQIDIEITGTIIEAGLNGDTVSVKLVEGKIKISSGSFAPVNAIDLKPGERLEADASSGSLMIFDSKNAVIKRHPELKRPKTSAAGGNTTQTRIKVPANPAPAVVNPKTSDSIEAAIIDTSAAGGVTSGEIKIEDNPDEVNSGVNPFQSN
ncbi:MAG: hypothetical protein A2008_02560 [Candidatus Wallbacteria bacterium GWC2_49_35]|uniref:FecR protein domain-containing protein n=1 Tax=Candidatus Wallbacteria bacterium GWC2_49_35 TaxID=1817813 RepID=A0A1F7WEY6_9BACT|nr:MAG: hypothetical protein A2008_02560 [Candidatus Wallbacteria bacterium GWC2_49_35]